MEEISLSQSLTALISMSMVLALLAVFMGLALKVYSILLAILAFPVYLGLYFIESALPIGENSVLRLNIPNKNPQKVIMNGAASFVSLSLLPLVEAVFKMVKTPESQIKLLDSAFEGRLSPPILLVFFLLGLITIYIVSYYFSEQDENGSWTKIENLSIPALWKVVAKGAV
jgi:hypothetical protein